jgi:hypothetical protein
MLLLDKKSAITEAGRWEQGCHALGRTRREDERLVVHNPCRGLHGDWRRLHLVGCATPSMSLLRCFLGFALFERELELS